MDRQRQNNRQHSDEPSVRRLQIVECTYRRGIASLDELAGLTGADTATIKSDIDTLSRGGLRISVDAEGCCRVEQAVPGFALRLTTQEAAAAWVRRWHCRECGWLMGCFLHSQAVAAACAILESGLRTYHPDGEERYRRWADRSSIECRASQREVNGRGQAALTGEAGRLCKRLRIFDLVESGKSRRRDELTALFGMCDRTLGNDLRVLRRAGLRIAYARGRGTYRVESLHTHLARELSLPGRAAWGAALLVLFGPRGDVEGDRSACEWAESVSRKIAKSVRLIFRKRKNELDAAMAASGADV